MIYIICVRKIFDEDCPVVRGKTLSTRNIGVTAEGRRVKVTQEKYKQSMSMTRRSTPMNDYTHMCIVYERSRQISHVVSVVSQRWPKCTQTA